MKTLESLVSGVRKIGKGLKTLAYTAVVSAVLVGGAGEAKADFTPGNLFVGVYLSNRGILEMDNLGNITREIDYRDGIHYLPQNLTFGPDGNLYVLRRDGNNFDHSIFIYNSEGDLLDKKSDFTSAPSSGLAFSPVNNHLYLVQGPGRIIELDENLNFLKVIANDINSSYDLAVDSQGNIYASGSSIRKYDIDGNFIGEFGDPSIGLAIGSNGNLFACANTKNIHEYNSETLELIRTIGDGSRPSRYLTLDLEGNIYATTSNEIRVYDKYGIRQDNIDVFQGQGLEIYISEPIGISLLTLGGLALLKRNKK